MFASVPACGLALSAPETALQWVVLPHSRWLGGGVRYVRRLGDEAVGRCSRRSLVALDGAS